MNYRLLARRQDLPDFKLGNFLKVGDFPIPLLVGEGGEVKIGQFSEARDTWALATYGRRVALTRQAIINDDLGAFQRMMQSVGERMAQFENTLWFNLLTSSTGNNRPILANDNNQLFSAAHNNLAAVEPRSQLTNWHRSRGDAETD